MRICLHKSYVGRFSPRKSRRFCQNIQNLSGIHHKTIVRLDWSGRERLLLSFLCVWCQHVSLTVMWEVTGWVHWPWRCLRRESLSFFFGRGEWKPAVVPKEDGLLVCSVIIKSPGCMGWCCLSIAGGRMGKSRLCSGARALRWETWELSQLGRLRVNYVCLVPYFSFFINKAKNQGFQGHRSPKFQFNTLVTRW